MVYIPKGEFIMGSDDVDKEAQAQQYGSKKPFYANERPKRTVNLKGFYMDKYEVTIANYKEFVNVTKHIEPDNWATIKDMDKAGNYPVIAVNWHDAKAYCEWRQKRLPTEAEWEKAARGTDGRRFPWGDEFDIKKVNTSGTYGGLLPVGSFEDGKSPYDIYDMAGNVSEWVEDWYKAYPGNDYNDKDYGEKFKVVKGGGWGGMGHYSLQIYVRASQRGPGEPTWKLNDIGFRCAKD